ncbi:O-antigen ligase family protein [Rubinisphaera margarita]|uniref:O-antigen ligase family protein n=1 Tax=Rubinisphaera margarita TaxID=2909586 RepID=UPI001EE88403|nr:O-antigen ligase family protein [Rubinisphaera margarita]MCG6154698.1 O-antigen ligase family protein [Rubinisphaera margarita]
MQEASRRPSDSPENGPSAGHSRWLSFGWCAINVLLWAQLFVPPEATVNGDLVLLHAPWLMGLAVVGWLLFKWRTQPIAFDGLDLCVLLLGLGPILSFGMLWATGGQLRTGVFVVLGWLATVVSVLLLRRFANSQSLQLTLCVLLVAGAAHSSLGIYQHYVFYDAAEAEVLPLIEEFQDVSAQLETGHASEFLTTRLKEKRALLERELSQLGVPLETHAQQMFLQRLRDSREPFGFFALANTLGGFLAVGLVLTSGLFLAVPKGPHATSRRIGIAVLWMLLAYCLLLTKSRTAWVGASVSLGGVFLFYVFRSANRKTLLKYGTTLTVVLAIFVAIAFGSGSLDKQVVSEAGKSLRYRLDFWRGSLAMLSESPLLGAGPGNFRQHYLAHKLPRSSEEILDPHNLWLDAAAGGGVIASGAVIALLILLLLRVLRGPASLERSGEVATPISGYAASVVLCSSVLLSSILSPPESARFLEETLFWTLVSGSLGLLLWAMMRETKLPTSVWRWAGLALLIHLHGAGGFSMPVIIQLLLVLTVGIEPIRQRTSFSGRRTGLVLLVTGGGLFLSSLYLAVLPRLSESAAIADLTRSRSPAETVRRSQEWAEADFWNPQPWQQIAAAKASPRDEAPSPQALKEALAATDEAIARDPLSYQLQSERADLWTRLYQIHEEAATLEKAIAARERAIEIYPANSELQFELASTLFDAGRNDAAAAVAKQSLDLDRINREYGHTDRYLTEDQLAILQKIVEKVPDSPTSSGD